MAARTLRILLVATLILAPAVATHSQSPPPAVQRPPVSGTTRGAADPQFMQGKLKISQRIVDGLMTEDFSAIVAASNDLLKLTEEAAWRVRRDPTYVHYSDSLKKQTALLRQAAKRGSIGDATFAYVNLTVGCVACHNDVRGVYRLAPGPTSLQDNTGRVVR